MINIRYTNVVLTIIAACLLAIAGDELGIVRKAAADSAPPEQRVLIAGYLGKDGKVYWPPDFTFTKDGSLRVVDTAIPYNVSGQVIVFDANAFH